MHKRQENSHVTYVVHNTFPMPGIRPITVIPVWRTCRSVFVQKWELKRLCSTWLCLCNLFPAKRSHRTDEVGYTNICEMRRKGSGAAKEMLYMGHADDNSRIYCWLTSMHKAIAKETETSSMFLTVTLTRSFLDCRSNAGHSLLFWILHIQAGKERHVLFLLSPGNNLLKPFMC